MSIPRGMSPRHAGVPDELRRAMMGTQVAQPPRSTMGAEQPFSGDDLGAVLAAMMGVPMPHGGAGMNAAVTQALRPGGRIGLREPTQVRPTRVDSAMKDAQVLGTGTSAFMREIAQGAAGMPGTAMMDDLPPLPPAAPGSIKAGYKYKGADAADLARRYDDEWWANHAANPPPPGARTAAQMEAMDPLPPLPPADPEFMQALQRGSMKTVPPPRRR